MRKEISSPAIKPVIPEAPFSWIDVNCNASGNSFVDRMGNTFQCNEEIGFWTNGITNATLRLDQSPINSELFSLSLCFSGKEPYPLFFGNSEESGVWLEIANGVYRFRNNAGILFSHSFENKFTFALVKENSQCRFFHNGNYITGAALNTVTSNNMTIRSGLNDRLVNLFMYKRAVTDMEISALYSVDFQSSKGLDHLGFQNSIQSFSMEI